MVIDGATRHQNSQYQLQGELDQILRATEVRTQLATPLIGSKSKKGALTQGDDKKVP